MSIIKLSELSLPYKYRKVSNRNFIYQSELAFQTTITSLHNHSLSHQQANIFIVSSSRSISSSDNVHSSNLRESNPFSLEALPTCLRSGPHRIPNILLCLAAELTQILFVCCSESAYSSISGKPLT